MAKEAILAAIKRAARELGRAPSRGELKRLTGVSHYRVLAEFRTLREAVRAAGLEPNRKGERISTEELVKDWKRVERKLGRRPSRSEYVREGRYSAGALTARFGSWGKINETSSTTEDTRSTPLSQAQGRSGHAAEHKGKTKNSQELTRRTRIGESQERKVERSDKAIAFQWARSLVAIPGPLEGKRRVTEAVAAMVVNTLMPASTQQSAASIQPNGNRFTTEGTENHLFPSFAQKARKGWGTQANGRLKKDRPVMGPPFSRHPLTNAPVNEMGVVFLFALVAWELGFQVESLWGRGYPDGRAKREVAPGKWQDVAIEFEYESKNFLLHGHDPAKCDVIVCWRHNWKECPEEIEVVELSRLF
jgi:hypothetical protein